MATIRCLYSCQGCGLHQTPVVVEERADGQDIVAWVKQTMVVVERDHRAKSPGCTSAHADLMIPLPKGDANLGEATRS